MKTTNNIQRKKMQELKDYFDRLNGMTVFYNNKYYKIASTFRRTGPANLKSFFIAADMKIYLYDADKPEPKRFSKNCILCAKVSSNKTKNYSLKKLANDYAECLTMYEDFFEKELEDE